MRSIGFVLAAILIAAALLAGWLAPQRTVLFDPALSRGNYPCSWPGANQAGPLDAEFDHWFGAPLRTANEPSLYRQAQTSTSTMTIRLTFLPSFSDPVIVRIGELYSSHPRLTAVRDEGQVVATEANKLSRGLSLEEVDPIRSLIESTAVLSLPPDSCLAGPDGVIYLIESAGPDGYRFVNRWGISDGPVYDLANEMYHLTGWPNGPQGPDRKQAKLER